MYFELSSEIETDPQLEMEWHSLNIFLYYFLQITSNFVTPIDFIVQYWWLFTTKVDRWEYTGVICHHCHTDTNVLGHYDNNYPKILGHLTVLFGYCIVCAYTIVDYMDKSKK